MIQKIMGGKDEEERVKTQQLVAKMANISNKLRKTAWKRNIMTEASTQFYDKHFSKRRSLITVNLLDTNPLLVYFNKKEKFQFFNYFLYFFSIYHFIF